MPMAPASVTALGSGARPAMAPPLQAAQHDPARIAEVQGLRAIAVMAVLFFHAGAPWMRGGFLGVDMFFVISGYVITLSIARQLQQGTFSIATFYVRRAKRLFPALAATLLATAAVFSLIAPPSVNDTLQPSLLTAAAGLANFYFFRTLDYFSSGFANPLLHTWSLGVEEQFYLVFPLLFCWAFRRGLPLRVMVVVLWACSVAAFQWMDSVDPSAAFFLPWCRAWEFLMGVAVALQRTPSASSTAWRPALLSVAGVLLVLPLLVLYDEAQREPLWAQLGVTGGTVLLLWAAQHRRRMVLGWLRQPVMQSVGNASYSIYLAHWPVACVIGMFIPAGRPVAQVAMVTAGLVLGYLCYALVEVPARGRLKALADHRAGLVPLSVAGLALLLMACVAAGNVLWARHPEALRELEASVQDLSLYRQGQCFISKPAHLESYDTARCLQGEASRPAVLVLGDSVAANIATSLQARFPQWGVLQATAVEYHAGHAARWPDFTRVLDTAVQRRLQSQPPVTSVVMFARWEESDLAPLLEQVRRLREQGIVPVVFGPSPEYFVSVPLLRAYSVLLGRDLSPAFLKPDRFTLDAAFQKALRGQAVYVSMMGALCSPGDGASRTCATSEGAHPLHSDKLHFTREGAAWLMQRVEAMGLPQQVSREALALHLPDRERP